MPNIDLMSILPLLSGGKNPDIAQILSAMGKAPPQTPPSSPPPAQAPSQSANNRADYSKLYPNTPINDLPRADARASVTPQAAPAGTDMSSMLQLIAALNASKKQAAPPPPPPPAQAPIAPTAPREIQDSLRAILTLNELGGQTRENR